MPQQAERQGSSSVTRQAITTGVIGVLAAIGGIVAAIYASETVLIKYSQLISVVITFIIGAVIIIGVYDLINQLRETLRDIEARQRDFESLNRTLIDRMPMLVTFNERVDKITVTSDGDGIFDCFYSVQFKSKDDVSIEEIHFPVVIDLGNEAGAPGSNVEVVSMSVNNINKSTRDAYISKEYRKLHGATVPQEYGIVKVPVGLSNRNPLASVKIRTKYKSIFKERTTADYVVIDIPYVTKQLRVVIGHEDDAATFGPPKDRDGKRTFEAICEMMELHDDMEELQQLPFVERTNDQISWVTESAKIGYRYKVWFSVQQQKAPQKLLPGG